MEMKSHENTNKASAPVTPVPEILYNNNMIKNKGAIVIANKSSINKGSIKNNDKIKFSLTKEQETMFNINLKIGILKQLHKDKLLTDEQLNLLISKQKY